MKIVAAIAASLALFSAPVSAQEIPERTIIAAEQAGIDPVDLQGALNVTGLDQYEYLYAVGHLARPVVARTSTARVRLTYYNLCCRTANGETVHIGGTACSYNWSFGTRFRLPDGSIVRCNDRGHLGSTGWLDVYGRPDLVRFGPYVTVEVLP